MNSHDVELLDVLSDITPIELETEAWRMVVKDRSPLHASTAPGRWGDKQTPVLYTSLERAGSAAEIHYHLSQQPVWPSRIRHQMCRLQVVGSNILDLTSDKALRGLGIDLKAYQKPLYHRTQAVGAAASFLGFNGLLSPNARHTSVNLTLFFDNCPIDDVSVLSVEDMNWAEWKRSVSNS